MPDDGISSANRQADTLESLRDAFSSAHADFHRSELRLVMVAGNRISPDVLRAITEGGICLVSGGGVQVAGDLYSLALVSPRPEEEAVAKFLDLAARGGAWLLATGRISGEGVAYSSASTLWFHAICEAFRGTKPRDCDGSTFWPLSAFGTSIRTLQWLGPLNSQPALSQQELLRRDAEPIRGFQSKQVSMQPTDNPKPSEGDDGADLARGEQSKTSVAAREIGLRELTQAVLKAYLAYEYAESMAEKRLNDRDAHTWLRENGIGQDRGDVEELADYEPPDSLETFQRYLSTARRLLGESKYNRRAGRAHGRSIARSGEVEFQKGDGM
jgi:hypothetical protein